MPVNRGARRAYAQNLRRLGAGRCTNDEFLRARAEIRERHGDDDGVGAVDAAAWHLYDDLREHRLSTTPALRRAIAHWIVFLHTDFAPGATPRVTVRSAAALVASLAMSLGWLTALAQFVWGSTGAATAAGAVALCCHALVWTLGGVSLYPRVCAAAFSGKTPDWPFADTAQFEAARQRPVFLNPGCQTVALRRSPRGPDRSSEVA